MALMFQRLARNFAKNGYFPSVVFSSVGKYPFLAKFLANLWNIKAMIASFIYVIFLFYATNKVWFLIIWDIERSKSTSTSIPTTTQKASQTQSYLNYTQYKNKDAAAVAVMPRAFVPTSIEPNGENLALLPAAASLCLNGMLLSIKTKTLLLSL